jgi:hypothetical protein
MTISYTQSRTSAVGSNAIGQVIPFTFAITDNSDIIVTARLIATGAETAMAEISDYVVTNNGTAGGSIATVAAWANTYQIHIRRVTPRTQELDLTSGGDFNPTDIEAELDKLEKEIQENTDAISRSLSLAQTDPVISLSLPASIGRPNTYLGFDNTGGLTCTVLVATGTVSFGAFGTTMAATATAAAARTALVLAPGTDVQAYSTHLAQIVTEPKTANYMLVADGTTWQSVAPAAALTSLGIVSALQSVVQAATTTAARAALGVNAANDIVCSGDAVVCNLNQVITV